MAERHGLAKKAVDFYDKHYLRILIFPALMLLLAIGVILFHYAKTGNFIETDVSLKGGITLTLLNEPNLGNAELNEFLLREFPKADITVRTLSEAGRQKGLIVDATDISQDELVAGIKEKIPSLTRDDYTAEVIGSSLGASFFRETIYAVLIAFLFMAVVVFLYFKIPVPSLAVVLAAFSDMVCTWAVMVLFDIKLSTAGVAALLMLIGYSVDTDILLTSRVLKRKDQSILDATLGAMRTGMTMSIAAIASVLVAYFFTSSHVIKQIMIILFIGLIFDILNTWLQNAAILRWYLERKEAKRKEKG